MKIFAFHDFSVLSRAIFALIWTGALIYSVFDSLNKTLSIKHFIQDELNELKRMELQLQGFNYMLMKKSSLNIQEFKRFLIKSHHLSSRLCVLLLEFATGKNSVFIARYYFDQKENDFAFEVCVRGKMAYIHCTDFIKSHWLCQNLDSKSKRILKKIVYLKSSLIFSH